MTQSSGRTFVALRTDGLGERLRAMLSAMVLAEATGGRFLFNWRARAEKNMEFHAILPPQEMFSPDFLEAYHCSDLDESTLISFNEFVQGVNDGVSASGEKVRVDQDGLMLGLPKCLLTDEPSSRVKGAFWKVGFSENLEYARRLAQSVPLGSEPTALHLRAGDITYGNHRFSGRFNSKICPFPLAVRVIEDCRGRGVRPIIFGQDLQLHDWLKETYDVIDPRDILAGENLSETQIALFELTLMSRCRHIFAGRSGFAILPALIAGVEPINPSRYVSQEELLDILQGGLQPEPEDSRVSSLQRAIACWSVLSTGHKRLTLDEKTDWAVRALKHDPVNSLYAMHAASALFSMEQGDRAETILLDHLSEISEKLRISGIPMLARAIKGNKMASDYLDIFRSAVERGAIIAAYYLANADRALGDNKQAAASAALFLARRPPELAYLDASLSWAGPKT